MTDMSLTWEREWLSWDDFQFLYSGLTKEMTTVSALETVSITQREPNLRDVFYAESFTWERCVLMDIPIEVHLLI